MFETLLEGHENTEKRFKKNFKNFGPKSIYWKNLKIKKKI